MLTAGTEWTTAVTDLINGIIAVFPMAWCLRRKAAGKRYRLWAAAFGMLALMSVAGFLLHGFEMSRDLNTALWCPMYLFLTLLVSAYAIAVRYDLDGEKGLSRFSRIILLLAAAVTVLLSIMLYTIPGYSFMLYSAFCLAVLVYCIVRLWRQVREKPAFSWYIAGILVLIAGSICQSIKSIQFTIIWEFNYNAVFHFMTLAFMLIEFKGVRLLGKKEA